MQIPMQSILPKQWIDGTINLATFVLQTIEYPPINLRDVSISLITVSLKKPLAQGSEKSF